MTPEALGSLIAEADSRSDGRAVAALAAHRTAEVFKRHQLELLRGPSGDELRERAGRHRDKAARSLATSAGNILRGAYRIGDVEELERLAPREVLARALETRYRPFRGSVRLTSRLVGVLHRTEDVAYAVFERAIPGASPDSDPGICTPAAMTLRREDGEWMAWLDGGLGVDALRVFAPEW